MPSATIKYYYYCQQLQHLSQYDIHSVTVCYHWNNDYWVGKIRRGETLVISDNKIKHVRRVPASYDVAFVTLMFIRKFWISNQKQYLFSMIRQKCYYFS